MKKIKLLLMVIISAFTLSGCVGYASHKTTNVNQQNTNVVLSQKNFHVVKHVSTKVKSAYLFGFLGGILHLENVAVAELTKKANLTGSQALANVVVKETEKVTWFIIRHRTIYAEATVIEFDK